MLETTLIGRIRRRVQDPVMDPPVAGRPLYSDDYYTDAIWNAVIWLESKTGTVLVYPPVTPGGELGWSNLDTMIIELFAARQMALVRATEGATSLVTDADAQRRVEVPNLKVEYQDRTREGTSMWRRLAADLMDDLERLLGPLDLTEVTMSFTPKFSHKDGVRTMRSIDRALADPIATIEVDVDGMVTVTWDDLYSHRVAWHRVERCEAADFESSQVVSVTYEADTHITEVTEYPTSGTWYYRVVRVSDTRIESMSETLTAVVP